MTRHGKPQPPRPFVGCGAALRGSVGEVVGCDRVKWHKGTCSTKTMRKERR